MLNRGRISRLYSDVILDRFKHPRFYGELDAPDATHEDVNPLCGDRIRVEVRAGRRGDRRGRCATAGTRALSRWRRRTSWRRWSRVGPTPEVLRVDRDRLLEALGAEGSGRLASAASRCPSTSSAPPWRARRARPPRVASQLAGRVTPGGGGPGGEWLGLPPPCGKNENDPGPPGPRRLSRSSSGRSRAAAWSTSTRRRRRRSRGVVLDAVRRYYERSNANVHRSIHTLGEEATELYEGARDRVRAFLGARHREEIVFTPGDHRGHQPRGPQLGPARPGRRATRSCSRRWSTTRTWCRG